MAAYRIPKQRFGELQVARALRDHREVVHAHGHPWMIVAENAPINLQARS
jgi:hypothetical protein